MERTPLGLYPGSPPPVAHATSEMVVKCSNSVEDENSNGSTNTEVRLLLWNSRIVYHSDMWSHNKCVCETQSLKVRTQIKARESILSQQQYNVRTKIQFNPEKQLLLSNMKKIKFIFEL